MEKFQKLLDAIKTNLKKHHPQSELAMVEEAYFYAQKAHEGQKRESGEPYFIHPLEVAFELSEKGMDAVVVSTALMHDLLEDTKTSKKEVEQIFGKPVFEMIEALTKLNLASFKSRQEQSTATATKTILAASKDVRVLVIKLFDKLNNLRTIKYLPKDRQKRIAEHTLTVYVPLAHKLGMHELKYELEDYCFKALDHKKYTKTKNKIIQVQKKKKNDIKKIIKALKTKHQKQKWTFGEKSKSVYAIYSKMLLEGKSIQEITDMSIVKIIVPTKEDCYQALGKIHETFTPIPGKIKDYIAIPEHGIYESLHTQIIGPSKVPIKIYIFSEQMEEKANDGIVYYLRNSTNSSSSIKKVKEMLSNLKNQEIKNEKELQNTLDLNFHNHINLVFTHNGEPIAIPRDATALDFAFFSNQHMAKKAAKAQINGKVQPVWTKLESGDRVKIFYSNTNQIGSQWLAFVNTDKAKAEIQKAIKLTVHKKMREFAKIKVVCVDRAGLLAEQAKIMAKNKIDLGNTLSRVNDDNVTYTTEMYIKTGEGKNLQKAINELKKIKETLNVTLEYL